MPALRPIAAPRLSGHAAQPLRAPMAAAAAAVSVAAMLPLAFIALVAAQTGLPTAAAMILRPRVAELLINTLLLLATTLPPAIALALATAWLTERSDLPGARIWAWAAVAPLGIPAFVHGYAWITLLPSLHGLPAAALVSVIAYAGFLYLPIAATLRRLDPALEDAAALGLPPARVFLRVVLPQLRLAICGGCLLVGLHLLAEYGLYGMIRFDTFTTAIMDQFQSAYSAPAANMLAGVLVVCCLALLAMEGGLRGRARYARLGAGAARARPRTRLGRLTLPCLALPAASAVLCLGVPLLTLARWLHAGGTAAWHGEELASALGQTILLAGLGAGLTVLAALPMAWLSIRSPGRMQRGAEAANYIVGALPGVVVALALVTFTVRIPSLYQTLGTILLAYATLFLPRAVLALRASIAQAPVELEQAAAVLGRPPLRAMAATTLRLAAPGAAAGFALTALGITNELTATMMLAPNGVQTLATLFWSYSTEIDYAAAAPYALIMVLFSLPLTWLLHWQSRRAAGR